MSTTDQNSKQWWRDRCRTSGYCYRELLETYRAIRSIEQEHLDLEKEIRIEATKLLFPAYKSPERWWVILHLRMRNIVQDGDMNAIWNFDDYARILAGMFPFLDQGEELQTTQFVFEFLLNDPGHMLQPGVYDTMKQAWKFCFGSESWENGVVWESTEEMAEVPF